MDSGLDIQGLIKLFIHQVTKGCGDPDCSASTCYSRRLAKLDKPLRRYTELSARAAAFHLATLARPWIHMCPTVVADIYSWSPKRWPEPLPNGEIEKRAMESQAKKDTKSYSQQLFDTRTIKQFLAKPTLLDASFNKRWQQYEVALSMAQEYVHSDPQWAPLAVNAILTCINGIAALLHEFSHPTKYREFFEDSTVFEFSRRLITVISELDTDESHACKALSCNSAKRNPETTRAIRGILAAQFIRSEQMHWKRAAELDYSERKSERNVNRGIEFQAGEFYTLLKCATSVLSRAWNGNSNVEYHSNAGQAVRVLSILHEMLRKLWPESSLSLMFRENHEEIPLQPMECAKQFPQRSSTTISLLEYPFLFSPQKQIEIFRALCFRRMERVVEEAHLNLRLLVSGMTWHSQDPPEVRQLVSGPLRTATARCFALQVSRVDLLNSLLNQLWRRERRELLRPLRVEITNEGEEGLDQGGVAQEMFQSALTTVLEPSYGMFLVDPLTKMTWFNPAALEPLHKFELLGVIFALAIHNGFILPVTFPRVFYQKLITTQSLSLSHEYIADGWPTLSGSFGSLLEWSKGDVEDIFVRQYAFSFEAFGEVIHVDMTQPHSDDWTLNAAMIESATNTLEAPLVNNKNRAAFVTDYIDWLVNKSIRTQFEAFARGFHSLIPRSLLATVTSHALQTLTEGHQKINMADLEAATTYDGGYTSSSPTIRNFWAVVGAYDDKHKRNLLEFITASDRLPVSGARGVRLLIQKNGGDGERLPTAMTCFATLLLPEYKEREKLRMKLEVVLGEARGFGLR